MTDGELLMAGCGRSIHGIIVRPGRYFGGSAGGRIGDMNGKRCHSLIDIAGEERRGMRAIGFHIESTFCGVLAPADGRDTQKD